MRTLWRSLRIALLSGFVCFFAITYFASHPFGDFIVYWTGSHLFATHQNPYSLRATYDFQQALGFKFPLPIVMLCPPWALAFFAPLGYTRLYLLSRICWFTFLVAAVALSSRILMDIYFGKLKIPEISDPPTYRYLFAFTFYPVLLALQMTQLGPLLLLAVSLFLYAVDKKRPVMAGLALALTTLKPHLLLLLFIILILEKQWRILLTSAVVVVGATITVVYHDHQILSEYSELMKGPYPRYVISGIFAGVRNAFPSHDTYWLQWVPVLLGLGWLVYYRRRNRGPTDWRAELPSIVTASVLFAPYGFLHDQTLLMIPIIALAAKAAKEEGRIPFTLVAFYTGLNVLILLLAIETTGWCILPAPVIFGLLLWWQRARVYIIPGAVHQPTQTV